MKEITLVTGNSNKLAGFQRVLPELALDSIVLDLHEIQSESLEEIAKHKVKAAYNILKKPVAVEDTGFFLEYWEGLPGPFLKYFEQRDEKDHLIRLLAGADNRRGYAKACIGYCDAERCFVVCDEVHGTVTKKATGGKGFGFDFSFIPDGSDKTIAQMTIKERDAVGHRSKVIGTFKKKYNEIA